MRATATAEPADSPRFADVVAAAGRLGPWVVHTPVVASQEFDARAGRSVFFKCENLQRGGAFKYRGALNSVLPLAGRSDVTCVVTHSSGNHGTALALAAAACGFAAKVIVPRDAVRSKLAAIERAGAEVLLCEPGLAAREAALAELLAREPAHLVHPFDDARVIAGQGTAALELLCEVPDLDVVCVPVGGGGLLGGTAIAVRGSSPRCVTIGAEPARADDAQRAFLTGERQSVGVPDTIADGLRASIGVLPFAILRRLVADIVTVDERAIIAAMRIVLGDLKLLIEPSSAVAVAAVLSGQVGSPGSRVGVILSGGNVDLEQCPFLRGPGA